MGLGDFVIYQCNHSRDTVIVEYKGEGRCGLCHQRRLNEIYFKSVDKYINFNIQFYADWLRAMMGKNK